MTPVLIDFDNNIIDGHGRVEAARAEGMTEVPCVLVSNLTEAQRKAYILADNRLSETSAWDTEALKIELEGLEALQFDTGIIGFDAEAVKEIEVSGYTRAAPGQGESSSVEDAVAEEDDFDGEPPETTAINHGDLYQMGRHRLLVGSTADESDMIRLMNGVLADMVFTDPPYNIASKSKNFAVDCSESMKVLSESDWDNALIWSQLWLFCKSILQKMHLAMFALLILQPQLFGLGWKDGRIIFHIACGRSLIQCQAFLKDIGHGTQS